MSERPLDIVILGLSITSSWGNGHATTYRALVQGLSRRGHRVAFLERDVRWYAEHRDGRSPPGCEVGLYSSLEELDARFARRAREADAVIVGSYVPEGAAVVRWAGSVARGVLAFYDIDTPVTLAQLAEGGAEYLDPELVPRFDVYLSFSGGRALDILQQRFGARWAVPLYCAVDPEAHRPTGGRPVYDLGYLGTYSADRQPLLESLLLEPARRWPERRFIVAGPQYPETIRWPPNVERVEHVAPSEHPRFYGSLRFTLNVTRADMASLGHSPSVRLFEAASCGVPILSDRWPGLESFLEPGRELFVVETAEDVSHLLRTLSPERARRTGERARLRVHREHSADRRALELEGALRRALGGNEEARV